MKTEITIPIETEFIIKRLAEHGHENYITGGCVRDLLLGKTPRNWNIVTTAPPEKMLTCFTMLTVIPTRASDGIVTVVMNNAEYECASFRNGDNKEMLLINDLSQRDFTINAMAYSKKTGLVDPFGGMKDLENKIIRCVGSPENCFTKDPLRILRAWRFADKFEFSIEDETLKTMDEMKQSIFTLSPMHLQEEFFTTLISLRRPWENDDLIKLMIPEWEEFDMDQKMSAVKTFRVTNKTSGTPAAYASFFGCFENPERCISVAESTMKRLKFSAYAKKTVCELITEQLQKKGISQC